MDSRTLRAACARGFSAVSALAATTLLLAAPSAMAAAASGCVTGTNGTFCLSLDPIPGDAVQPSGMSGSETFVRYAVSLSQVNGDLDDDLVVRFNLVPAVDVTQLTLPPDGRCTVLGAGSVECRWNGDGGAIQEGDHGNDNGNGNGFGHLKCRGLGHDCEDVVTVLPAQSFLMTVKAPAWAGAATPAQLLNVANLGFNAMPASGSVTHTLPVRADSGETWCPPYTQCRVATAPPAASEASQTDGANPIYALLTVTSGANGFPIDLDFIADGVDRTLVCPPPAHVYFDPMGDGGPFLCRDNNNPTRWLQVYAGEHDVTPPYERNFFNPPMEIRLIWDTTLVSPLQIDLEEYPFAVFYFGTDEFGNADPIVRAFKDKCGATPLYPCIQDIEQLSSGDWAVTFKSRRVEDLQGGYTSTAPTPKPPIGNF